MFIKEMSYHGKSVSGRKGQSNSKRTLEDECKYVGLVFVIKHDTDLHVLGIFYQGHWMSVLVSNKQTIKQTNKQTNKHYTICMILCKD